MEQFPNPYESPSEQAGEKITKISADTKRRLRTIIVPQIPIAAVFAHLYYAEIMDGRIAASGYLWSVAAGAVVSAIRLLRHTEKKMEEDSQSRFKRNS